MNRHPRNRGGRQGHHNPRSTRHTRNNTLYEDLFDTSVHSIAPSEASIDSMPILATPERGEPMDAPLPTEGVRRRLGDYARPVVQGRLRESMPLFNEVPILKLTHIFLAFYPSFMDYHRRIYIDMWTNSASYANSINSTMSPPRRPRCASSPSRLRKGQRSGFSPWVVSLLHGEIWKTHFCISTTW